MKEFKLFKFDTQDETAGYCDSLRANYEMIRLEEYLDQIITVYRKKGAYQVFFTITSEGEDELELNMIVGKNIEKMLGKILEIRGLKEEFRQEEIEGFLKILEK